MPRPSEHSVSFRALFQEGRAQTEHTGAAGAASEHHGTLNWKVFLSRQWCVVFLFMELFGYITLAAPSILGYLRVRVPACVTFAFGVLGVKAVYEERRRTATIRRDDGVRIWSRERERWPVEPFFTVTTERDSEHQHLLADFGLSFCLSVRPCGIKESQNEQADPFSTFSSPRAFPLSALLLAARHALLIEIRISLRQFVCLRCEAECLTLEFIITLTYISLCRYLSCFMDLSSMPNHLLPLMQLFPFHLLKRRFYIFLFCC